MHWKLEASLNNSSWSLSDVTFCSRWMWREVHMNVRWSSLLVHHTCSIVCIFSILKPVTWFFWFHCACHISCPWTSRTSSQGLQLMAVKNWQKSKSTFWVESWCGSVCRRKETRRKFLLLNCSSSSLSTLTWRADTLPPCLGRPRTRALSLTEFQIHTLGVALVMALFAKGWHREEVSFVELFYLIFWSNVVVVIVLCVFCSWSWENDT